MKNVFLLATLVLCLAACRPPAKPTITAPVGDPAYRFTAGDVFFVTFSERLMHTPRSAGEPVAERTTLVRFDVTTVDVRADGVAQLHFVPRQSQVTIQRPGKKPLMQSGWIDRGKDRFDLSLGVRYLRDIDDYGLHAVVSPEGMWLRDFRGGEPPADLLTRDQWSSPVTGLTVYPQKERKRTRPAMMGVFVPADWRKRDQWEQPLELAPQPPMTGLMPLVVDLRVERREGTMLFLRGGARQDGRARAKSPFGLVLLGDVTIDLHFKKASSEVRFDLELGLPAEVRQEFHWSTQRYVDGIGEVISDDAQVLNFRARRQTEPYVPSL